MTIVAYSYIRFSHADQAKGDSLRRQLEKSAALASRKGWTLDDILLSPDLGRSAFRGRNAETGHLAAFLLAIREGKVRPGSVLIIENIDRLSRNSVMEAQALVRDILEAGVVIFTCDPEREYSWDACNKNPFAMMELLLYQIRANEESRVKSERVAASWEARRRRLKDKPATSNCPSWLYREGNRFVVIPESVAVVRRIFDMAIGGMGVRTIAKTLNGEGVPPFGRKPWSMVYVRDLLRSRTVLGEYQPMRRGTNNKANSKAQRVKAGEPVMGYYPAVISEETFWRAQGAINARQGIKGRRGKSVSNLFTGLVFDARDGRQMVLRDNGKPGGKALVSVGAVRGQTDFVLGFNYDLFEAVMLNFVKGLELDPVTDDMAARIEAEEGRLADIDKRIAGVESAALKEGDFDLLLSVARQLDGARTACVERLERLRAEAVARHGAELDEAKDIVSQLESAAGEELEVLRERVRAKFRQLVSEIWVLIGSDGRHHRRATVEVYLRRGGKQFFQIEHRSTGPNRGTEIATMKDGCEPFAIDLRQVRFQAGGGW